VHIEINLTNHSEAPDQRSSITVIGLDHDNKQEATVFCCHGVGVWFNELQSIYISEFPSDYDGYQYWCFTEDLFKQAKEDTE